MIWLKIKKEYLNMNENFIIGGIYNSPINSSYTKSNDVDIFEKIQDKIMTFPKKDYILVGGDFNARVGNMQDFIEEDEDDLEFLDLPQNYQIDRFKKLRSNQDQHKNTYGHKLIELAISSKMKILNGRTLGDLMGKFTYIGYNGISTVDYVLGSENLLLQNYIHSFEVEELTLLSDHRPISLTLQYNANKQNVKTTPVTTTLRKKRFILNDYEIFKTELNRQMNNTNVNRLLNKMEGIEKDTGQTSISSVDKIIQEIADICKECRKNWQETQNHEKTTI